MPKEEINAGLKSQGDTPLIPVSIPQPWSRYNLTGLPEATLTSSDPVYTQGFQGPPEIQIWPPCSPDLKFFHGVSLLQIKVQIPQHGSQRPL